MDTDASVEAAAAGGLACEGYVLQKGKLQIESLRNLDQVHSTGVVLVAAYPNIVCATGMPMSVWAVADKN